MDSLQINESVSAMEAQEVQGEVAMQAQWATIITQVWIKGTYMGTLFFFRFYPLLLKLFNFNVIISIF